MICHRPSFVLFVAVACLGLMLAAGCGVGSDAATISGTVVSNGAPLPAGQVVFSSDSATCSGEVLNGKYQLMNQGRQAVPLVEYTITVFPPGKVYNPDTGEEEAVQGIDLSLFPKKYQRKGTSDLKFSPVAGHNEFEIVLKK